MKQCLLVIDVQQSFAECDYFDAELTATYLQAQNALIAACEAQAVPIVRIFHIDDDVQFRHDSGLVRPLDGLVDFDAAHTLTKHRHSSLVGTDLGVWLTQNGITDLLISGIRTEQCCETTTRHASDLGYRVQYVLDATLTFDMRQPDGQTLTADAIKMRTATVLQDRFADVVSVQAAQFSQ